MADEDETPEMREWLDGWNDKAVNGHDRAQFQRAHEAAMREVARIPRPDDPPTAEPYQEYEFIPDAAEDDGRRPDRQGAEAEYDEGSPLSVWGIVKGLLLLAAGLLLIMALSEAGII